MDFLPDSDFFLHHSNKKRQFWFRNFWSRLKMAPAHYDKGPFKSYFIKILTFLDPTHPFDYAIFDRSLRSRCGFSQHFLPDYQAVLCISLLAIPQSSSSKQRELARMEKVHRQCNHLRPLFSTPSLPSLLARFA